MNEFQELRIHVAALNTTVDHNQKFFASILHYVHRLQQLLTESSDEISRDEIKMLADGIEEFFKEWRPSTNPSPGVLYIPPRETADADKTVSKINKLVDNLVQLTEGDFIDKAKQAFNRTAENRREPPVSVKSEDRSDPSATMEPYQASSALASWVFGGLILIFLMTVVLIPIDSSKFPIVRFLMALSAAFFAIFFVGGVLLRGTLNGLFISATGGFVLFILIQFVFDPFKVLPSASSPAVQGASAAVTPTPNQALPLTGSPSPSPPPTLQKTNSPQTPALSGNSTPTPAPSPKPNPNEVHRFYFIYMPDDPGLRERHKWWKTDDGTWIEQFPNGDKNIIRIVDRITVEGDPGTLLELTYDPSLEYFIPDKGGRLMWLRTRRKGGEWGFLGEMKDVV